MSVDTQLIRGMVDIEKRLERLESQEQRRLITDYDYLRGWKDDFFGKQIADQYTAASNGAGSGGALQNNAHGGVYRLTAGAGAGFYHYLWLGNAADGYATLDADVGWVMTARMGISAMTSTAPQFGAMNSTSQDVILCGMNTGVLANNWVLLTRSGGGANNVVDTGVAADTNPHWHALNVYPIAGGLRQVDYFLDGARIASTSVSVPIAVLTPMVRAYALAAAARYVDLDTWITIPRNL